MRWLCILFAWMAYGQTDAMRASIAKQKESIRKQAEKLQVWLPPVQDEPVAPQPVAAAVPPKSDPSCDTIQDTIAAPIIEADLHDGEDTHV